MGLSAGFLWEVFSLQPSELVKFTLVLALAKYFDEHKLDQGYYLRELGIPLLLLLVPFILILEQPDLGTGLILLIVSASLFLFVGIRLKSLAYVASLVFADDACGLVFHEGVSKGKSFNLLES